MSLFDSLTIIRDYSESPITIYDLSPTKQINPAIKNSNACLNIKRQGYN